MKIIQLPTQNSLLASSQKWVEDLLTEAHLIQGVRIEKTETSIVVTSNSFGISTNISWRGAKTWGMIKTPRSKTVAGFHLGDDGTVIPSEKDEDVEGEMMDSIKECIIPYNTMEKLINGFMEPIRGLSIHVIPQKGGGHTQQACLMLHHPESEQQVVIDFKVENFKGSGRDSRDFSRGRKSPAARRAGCFGLSHI